VNLFHVKGAIQAHGVPAVEHHRVAPLLEGGALETAKCHVSGTVATRRVIPTIGTDYPSQPSASVRQRIIKLEYPHCLRIGLRHDLCMDRRRTVPGSAEEKQRDPQTEASGVRGHSVRHINIVAYARLRMEMFAHIWFGAICTFLGLMPGPIRIRGKGSRFNHEAGFVVPPRRAIVLRGVALVIAAVIWIDLFLLLTGRPTLLH
jgi:hypothetical protein